MNDRELFENPNARTRAAHVCASLLAAIAAVAVVASPAGAHVGGPTHGLADGALHPLTGVDHLLAMVAVGMVAALAAPARRADSVQRTWWTVAFAFLGGMAIGGGLALVGMTLPGVEVAIVGSVIVLGVAVVVAPWARSWGLVALVAAAGFAHGSAHGAEAPSAAHPVLYVLGFLAVTAGLHLAGVAVGAGARRVAPLRVAIGAMVATAGVLLLL